MAKRPAFNGFGPEAFEFLTELTDHNHKRWFDANKERYEETIREPARELIRAFAPRLKKISPHLVADDRKVGGSLMRIYRDVRFSKDKTPYKTHVGIHFRHAAGKDVHAPGCYLHIGVDGCFLGMGMWRPDSKALVEIREAIVEDPKAWKKASQGKRLRDAWTLGGESLKRPPRGFDKDHPMVEDLKRKDHILTADLTPEQAESPELLETCMERFARGRPHMRFLCEAIGVAF